MRFVRLIGFGFIALSAIYLLISVYSRSVRREKLEKDWAGDHPGDEDSPARAAFIEDGMTQYQHGLRRKLILLVYIIPTILVIGILIATN